MTSVKLLNWAAGLSILAGLSHGALVEEHLEESLAVGAFFVLAALAQAIFGFVVLSSHLMNGESIAERWPLRMRRAWYAAGAGGNLLLIWIYLASRTTGFFGKYEAWSAGGIFVKTVELAIVVLLGLLLFRMRRVEGAASAAQA